MRVLSRVLLFLVVVALGVVIGLLAKRTIFAEQAQQLSAAAPTAAEAATSPPPTATALPSPTAAPTATPAATEQPARALAAILRPTAPATASAGGASQSSPPRMPRTADPLDELPFELKVGGLMALIVVVVIFGVATLVYGRMIIFSDAVLAQLRSLRRIADSALARRRGEHN